MNKSDAIEVVKLLKEMYPEAKCSLNFETPFEMLVAVCLSAQCTDERVNQVTSVLFKKYSKPEDFANIDTSELEKLIYSCGFYKNKAKNLINASKKILNDFNGIVPDNMEDLMTIPGVGRKSANVIMTEAFHNSNGIAVDTHCKRVSNRLGFSNQKDPSKIEKDLCSILPKEYWKDINHLFIYHGRNICTSQKPKCDLCKLNSYCKYYKKVPHC